MAHCLKQNALVLVAAALVALPQLVRADEPAPATQPTTKPAQIAPDAQALLARVRDAYASIQTLRLDGQISADMQVDGQVANEKASFTSSYVAPTAFRHQVENDLLVGSTGSKLYMYQQARNVYVMADVADPKARFPAGGPPLPYGERLQAQNPSLQMAVSADAAATLTEGFTSIERSENLAVDGVDFPSLRMTNEQGLVCVVLVDPNTSLVRRLSVDARQAFLRRGATDVPKADIVFDYTHLEPQAKIEAAQFAWSPPEGATEVRQPSGGPGGEASALVGQPAPEFSLVDMQGNTVTLSAQKGSVVVLDFWATWCGPCVQSLPALDQISRDMAPSGVKVFAVNVGEDKEQVQGFLNSRKIGLTTLLDADNAVGDAYKAAGIPQTVIIDKAGVVQKVFVGSGHEDEIRQQIEKALAS